MVAVYYKIGLPMKRSVTKQTSTINTHTHTNSSSAIHVKFRTAACFLMWFIPNSPLHLLSPAGHIPFSPAQSSAIELQALVNKRNKTK